MKNFKHYGHDIARPVMIDNGYGNAMCRSRCNGYACTRKAGHAGEHQAGLANNIVVAEWEG